MPEAYSGWGAMGAKPPPGPVKSIDFRGFSGPQFPEYANEINLLIFHNQSSFTVFHNQPSLRAWFL